MKNQTKKKFNQNDLNGISSLHWEIYNDMKMRNWCSSVTAKLIWYHLIVYNRYYKSKIYWTNEKTYQFKKNVMILP